jgi:hypothetical protein
MLWHIADFVNDGGRCRGRDAVETCVEPLCVFEEHSTSYSKINREIDSLLSNVAVAALYLHREEHQRISSINLSRNGFPPFSVPLKPKGTDFERDSEVVFQNINLQAELCYGHAGRIGISLDVRLASIVGYD